MDEIEVPPYFLCPISLQIMKDPVAAATGITYDRDSIQRWVKTSPSSALCPVTKQPLSRASVSDLTPNHMLRRLIQAWCISNEKMGIDRIPSPKSPLDRSTVLKLVRDLKGGCSHDSEKTRALKKMDELAGENERNRKLMAEAGVAKEAFLFILRCSGDGEIDCLHRALRVLQMTWTTSTENLRVLEENYMDRFVDSVFWILNYRMDSAGKTLALAILKNLTQIMAGSLHLETLKSSFFEGMVKALRSRISSTASRSALQILIEAAPRGRNRAKIVEAGGVIELVEMELERPPEKRTTELVFYLLAQLCSCADGRQQFLSHAGGIALAAKRLLRVSPATDDQILIVMDAVARFAATPEVVAEMLRVSAVSKLCMVLQADCSVQLKKKAREILRLHTGVWSNSPCIQVYLLTWHAR